MKETRWWQLFTKGTRGLSPLLGLLAPDDRLITAALTLLLLAVYLSTTSLRFQSADELAVFVLARNLIARGGLDTDGMFWMYLYMGEGSVIAPGLGGHMYSLKDIAPSLLIAPLVWLAYRLGISPVRTAFLLPPLITALTGGLLYRLLRDEGYRRITALLGVLTYGLASMAWPYAQTLFTQTTGALGLLIATWGVLKARQGGGWRTALAAGLGMGLAGASILPAWITAPLFVLALLPRSLRRWREALPHLAAFVLAAGVVLAGQGLYNTVRFGSPLDTGHVHVVTSAVVRLGRLWLGGLGQLFSTPRGVIWYAPFVLLVPFGAVQGWRTRRAMTALALGQVALIWVIYSGWTIWWAGVSWGPRYLVAVMPALVLLTVPALERLIAGEPLLVRLAAAAILLASFLTQALASLFDALVVEGDINLLLAAVTWGQIAVDPYAVFISPSQMPQVRLLRLVQARNWDVLWMAHGQPDGLLIALLALLIIAALAALLIAFIGPLRRLANRMVPGTACFSLALAALMVIRYPHAPEAYLPAETTQWAALDKVVEGLAAHAVRGDGLVLLLPDGYLAWVDRYRGDVPEANFFIEPELRPEVQAMLEHMVARHPRLWLVTQSAAHGNRNSAVEQWLAERGYIGGDLYLDEVLRLSFYTFGASAGGPPMRPLGVTFGDGAARLDEVGWELERHPGACWLNVALRWDALRPLPLDYSVTVQLFDAAGARLGQHDGWPAAGYAPTSLWQPGQTILDRHSLLLPSECPSGTARLFVGLYDWRTGERLPASAESGELWLDVPLPSGEQ